MISQMKFVVFSVLVVWVFFASLSFPSQASGGESEKVAGDVIQVLIPTLAYGLTFGKDDPEGRNQFYKGFLTTLTVTHAMKRLVNSTRPNGSRFAFPAGHVSAAFSGAAFLGKRYGWRYGLPAYLGAMYVGWSRVDSDEHFTEDVIAGAAIGMAASYYFTQARADFRVFLASAQDGYFLMIQKRW